MIEMMETMTLKVIATDIRDIRIEGMLGERMVIRNRRIRLLEMEDVEVRHLRMPRTE